MTAVPAGTPAAPGNYVPGVDGLRAIAVLAVMLYHLKPSWMPGGFVGVDVFFVISGYVVTGSLVRHAPVGLGRFLLDFYSRRFRRILPALVVCLLASIAFVVLFVPNAWLSDAVRDTSLAAFLGFSNFALLAGNDGYFAPRAEFNPFTHTWSLAVEEQFYLLYPFLLFAWLRAANPTSRLVVRTVFGILIVASLAWCAVVTQSRPDHAYFMLASRYWELAAGASLFLARQGRPAGLIARVSPTAAVLLGLALIATAMVGVDKSGFPFPWALPAVLGSLCVIAGATQAHLSGHRPVSWLGSGPMVAVGLRSYSLYLWHWPIYTAFRWTLGLESPGACLAAVALTFVAAQASYAWVEAPIQGRRRLASWAPLGVVATGLASVALGWAGARQLYQHQAAFSQSVVMRNEAQWYPHPELRTGNSATGACKVEFSSQRLTEVVRVQEFKPTACDKPAWTGGRLYVVGDSHASAYRRMFHMLAQDTGMPVTLYPAGGCAVASLMGPEARQAPHCREFKRFALQQVAQRAKAGDVVFLAALRSNRFEDVGVAPTALAGAASAPADDQADALAFEEAKAVVAQLSALGVRVIIDAPKPVFRSPPFRCSDWFNRMNPVCAGGLSLDRSEMEARRLGVMRALKQLQAVETGLAIWDPLPVLCPGSVCEAAPAGLPLYFDGDHISGLANERLLPSFMQLLASMSGAAQTPPSQPLR